MISSFFWRSILIFPSEANGVNPPAFARICSTLVFIAHKKGHSQDVKILTMASLMGICIIALDFFIQRAVTLLMLTALLSGTGFFCLHSKRTTSAGRWKSCKSILGTILIACAMLAAGKAYQALVM